MKVMAAVIAFVAGEPMNVSAVCEQGAITRQTFYKYAARYRVEGIDGFKQRSRRPHRSPGATSLDVEDAVVALRKELTDIGVDAGSTTICWHLDNNEQFVERVPSPATIHRILVRRGFVVAQPDKRPRSSWKRFEASVPNERWQIDFIDWQIAVGLAKVFNLLDDHSRVACRSRAVEQATTDEAWTTFCQAAQRWGLPAAVLSDNGLCFSGKLHGFEVVFEANLRDAGIAPVTSRPFHPQTCGKVERFQQTLKKWLRRQDELHGLAADLAELQTRLDEFCTYYNHERPHQGIARRTPISRWHATPPASPGHPLSHPFLRPEPHTAIVNADGMISLHQLHIGVGTEWAGCPVTVIIDATYATVLTDHQLVRHLKIDHTRIYQPTRRRRGGPRRTRHLPS